MEYTPLSINDKIQAVDNQLLGFFVFYQICQLFIDVLIIIVLILIIVVIRFF